MRVNRGQQCRITDECRRTLVWRLRGTIDLDVKVPQVVVVGNSADSGDSGRNSLMSASGLVNSRTGGDASKASGDCVTLVEYLRLGNQPLRLLDNSLWQSHGKRVTSGAFMRAKSSSNRAYCQVSDQVEVGEEVGSMSGE